MVRRDGRALIRLLKRKGYRDGALNSHSFVGMTKEAAPSGHHCSCQQAPHATPQICSSPVRLHLLFSRGRPQRHRFRSAKRTTERRGQSKLGASGAGVSMHRFDAGRNKGFHLPVRAAVIEGGGRAEERLAPQRVTVQFNSGAGVSLGVFMGGLTLPLPCIGPSPWCLTSGRQDRASRVKSK